MSEFTPGEAKGLPNERTDPVAHEEKPPAEPSTGVSRPARDARRTEVRDEEVTPVDEEEEPAAAESMDIGGESEAGHDDRVMPEPD